MSEGRRNSIGTLTGWQLLAKQVGKDEDEEDSAADSSSDGDDAEAETDNSRQRLHLRSLSNTSTLSEESGLGSTACVTPRPHQWLYKEYKILDEIGSGGFGRVCRARRLADGRVVVVKEINTTSLSAKQKSATMDEVLVLAKLNHPNIVKYHDCYMDAVYINIVMEHCNAGDLAGLIKAREGRFMPEEEVMSLFVQICLAMHYVHAAGVLHRDLKSSNVLITRANNFGGMPLLKLGDFGVAKMNSAESSMASTIVGTPQYLSPEMCDNKPYGKKSDVWALGCILYELCCLTKAFDLGTGGISGIILKIMRGTYEPLPAVYSDEMKGLVGMMLQVKPKRRPSVADLLQLPYVRRHLIQYLDWARNVPQAHPQVLQASLGELWPRKGQQEAAGQHHQQQHPQQHGLQQHPPMLETIGSGGSCSSMDTPQHVPTSPSQQQQGVQQPPLLEQQGSSPHLLYAASSRAATPASHRISGTGSNSSFIGPASGSAVSSTDLLIRQSSNMSQSARSGSATPRSAAAAAAAASAAAAAAAAGQLAPAGSNAEQEQREQQHDMQSPWVQAAAAAAGVGSHSSASLPLSGASSPITSSGPVPALSGPSGGPPPGSLSGWLGGDTSLQKRQQIQQQVLAAQPPHDQQPQPQPQQQPAPLAKQPQASLSASLQLSGQEQHDKQQPDQLSQPLVNLELSPQLQQQRRTPRMSCPNPGELLVEVRGGPDQAVQVTSGPPLPLEHNLSTTSSHSADNLAAGWAYPSVSADTHRVVNRTSLAQEQMDGLKAIWGLKAKLQVKSDASGPPASGPLTQDQLLQQGQVPGAGVHQQQQQQQQQQQLGPGTYWAIAEADTAMHI